MVKLSTSTTNSPSWWPYCVFLRGLLSAWKGICWFESARQVWINLKVRQAVGCSGEINTWDQQLSKNFNIVKIVNIFQIFQKIVNNCPNLATNCARDEKLQISGMTLIKCLKCHKSPGSPKYLSEWVTRSPIDLFWTAKNSQFPPPCVIISIVATILLLPRI